LTLRRRQQSFALQHHQQAEAPLSLHKQRAAESASLHHQQMSVPRPHGRATLFAKARPRHPGHAGAPQPTCRKYHATQYKQQQEVINKKTSSLTTIPYSHRSTEFRPKGLRLDGNGHPCLCTGSSSLRFQPLTEVILRHFLP
jgi:hypothetical protein